MSIIDLVEGIELPVRGVAQGPRPDDDHHQAFNEAFSDAVTKYAAMRSGRPTEGQKLSVTLSIVVSVENPGRIEGYVVDVG
jgi:hypothetical protein